MDRSHPRWRSARLLSIALVMLFFVSLVDVTSLSTIAQDAAEPASTESIAEETPPATEELPTEIATQPLDRSDEPAPAETATEVATEAPVEVATETLATQPSEEAAPAEPTPVPTDIATQEPVAPAADGSGVKVTINIGDNTGPPLANVCMRLLSSFLGLWQSNGCTDAAGQITLPNQANLSAPTDYTVEIDTPFGYEPVESIAIVLVPGQIAEAPRFVQPIAAATETFYTVDSATGAPRGGACWSYYANTGQTPGALALGPACDTDNDGTTVVENIPYGAYCIIVTPPDGYSVVGGDTICADAGARNRTITKAVTSSAEGGDGSVAIAAETDWGAPLSGVCLAAIVELTGGASTEVATGCTAETGELVLDGLIDGAYTLVARSVPAGFALPADTAFGVTDGNAGNPITLVVSAIPSGDITLTAYLAAGPQTLPGTCWSYAVNDGGAAGNTVIGPVCDDDGDGIAVLEAVPSGAFCVVVTPPTGYYRPAGDYALCLDELHGDSSGRLGFAPIPATPTPTPTTSPTPTPTPVVTPPPVGNEPNSTLTVRNCFDSMMIDGTPRYELCRNVPAGVRFAVMQHDAQIAVVTTDAGGYATVTLERREPFSLRYLDRNGSDWVPGAGEEAMVRYGEKQLFTFAANPDLDRTLTLTARAQSNAPWANGRLYGGACYKVVGADGVEYIAETCDTDGDGIVALGQLPLRYSWELGAVSSFYNAVMTVPPAGMPLYDYPGGGVYDPSTPNEWTYTAIYTTNVARIRTVDEAGNPVEGFCFAIRSVSIYAYCDNDGGDYREPGVISINDLRTGTYLVELVSEAAGYRANLDEQYVTFTDATPFQDVTFVVRPYGDPEPTRARARIKLDFPPGVDATDSDLFNICFSLTPNLGVPSGWACSSFRGEAIFGNLPLGTYTVNIPRNQSYCTYSGVPITFSITESDLGTEKIVPVVMACSRYSWWCTIQRPEAVRSVDVYVGSLRDSEGNEIAHSLQLSESISPELMYGLTQAYPELFSGGALAPWTDVNDVYPYLANWNTQADWEGNAYAQTLAALGHPAGVAIERTLQSSAPIPSGAGHGFVYLDWPDDLDPYPECPSYTRGIQINIPYTATVNIYTLTATENGPASPTPTPIVTPEPVCNTTVSRDLTAFYGTLTDGETGATIQSGLALSDQIPAALSDAIEGGSAPGTVADDIGNWVGAGLSDEEWAELAPENRDAEANLRSQFSSGPQQVSFDEPQPGGSVEYRYTSFRYLDAETLPGGCSLPEQSGFQPAWSLLVPVSQETVVTVTYTELNATRLAQPATTTPTPSEIPSATTTTTATASTTPSPSGPTPTTGPVTVKGLPNTGSGPAFTTRDGLLLTTLGLIFALLLFSVLIFQKRR